jgi:hypothetical protein
MTEQPLKFHQYMTYITVASYSLTEKVKEAKSGSTRGTDCCEEENIKDKLGGKPQGKR